VEPVSLPSSGLSIPEELANPVASVPLVKKSLRFTLPSFHSLLTSASEFALGELSLKQSIIHDHSSPARQFEKMPVQTPLLREAKASTHFHGIFLGSVLDEIHHEPLYWHMPFILM
jgi:hypothetical protein